MKHTALIITAGSGSGAHFGVPFLLPALRHAAAACCETVEEVTEDGLEEALGRGGFGGAVLLLDIAMPLITAEDCRLLIEQAEKGTNAIARDAKEVGTPAEFRVSILSPTTWALYGNQPSPFLTPPQAENGYGSPYGAIPSNSRRYGGYPRCMVGQSRETACVALGKDALWRVESPQDLAHALKVLRRRTNDALMASGVILLDPKRTDVDPDVRIGTGTVVYPGCTIKNGTVIGEKCTLYPNSRIEASRIGDETTVESSVLTDCEIGRKTTVGPFAFLRPKTKVGDGCRIGDFVEIKNSVIGDGTKVSHLTYVGDSDLGERINLGCGVVFVNYDGKQKHRTTVADDAFVGCNVNLVSPVHIGEGAYVAAGSTITEDVPAEAFAIARERQTVKEGWVRKRKMEGKL